MMHVLGRAWHQSRLVKLLLMSILALFIASYIFYLFEQQAPASEYHSYPQALRGIIILLVSGFDIDAPLTSGGFAAAVLCLLFGLIVVATLTAEVASIYVEGRLLRKKGIRQVNKKDHIIVCNTGPHLSMVIEQLTSDQVPVRRPIIIISEEEPEGLVDGEQVFWVYGDPSEDAVLHKASVEHARTAIILSADTQDPAASDAHNILTALAIEAINGDVYTCVELMNESNKKHLHHANVDEVVCIGEVGAKLVVQSALNPGLANLLGDLLSFDENGEFYRCAMPLTSHGKSFRDALVHLYDEHGAVLVALERGGEHILKQESDVTVQAGDVGVILANEMPPGLKAPV